MDEETIRKAKKIGISDKYMAQVWGKTEAELFLKRKEMIVENKTISHFVVFIVWKMS